MDYLRLATVFLFITVLVLFIGYLSTNYAFFIYGVILTTILGIGVNLFPRHRVLSNIPIAPIIWGIGSGLALGLLSYAPRPVFLLAEWLQESTGLPFKDPVSGLAWRDLKHMHTAFSR